MNEKPDNNKKQYAGALIFGLLLLLIFNALVVPMLNADAVKETEYSYFLEQIDEGNVQKVEINSQTIDFTTDDDKKYSTVRIDDPELVDRLREDGNIEFTGVSSQQSPLQTFLFGDARG